MNLRSCFIVLLISALLLSCGGNKSSEDGGDDSPSLSEAIGGMRNLNKAAEAAEDWEKKQSDLLGQTPLTNDEMKALLPESLAGMKRTRFTVGDASMMGLVTAQATYSDDQNKSVELSVMDGAGEAGSGVIAIYVMSLSMDMEEETESGFSKNTTLNGYRASIKEQRGDDWVNSEIATLVSDRYLVTLSGTGLAYKELEEVFNGLDLKGLK